MRLIEYPLRYHDAWQIDLDALAAAITSRTRAIIVVHPNNPTGHFCSTAERAALQSLCATHNIALIVDEVFLDYPLSHITSHSFAADQSSALTFVLSGISKICGLPQMKCSWIAATGPQPLVDTAMARLEIIADTFLSVSAPIQHALPKWLGARHGLQQQLRERMITNLATMDTLLTNSTCQRLHMDAGWATILRVPRNLHGIAFAEAALADGVLVQPGSFYALPEGRIVLSLLTPPDTWREGITRLAALSRT